MPSDKQHLGQAKHNINFFKSFYSNHDYNDWAITVAFYAAVHILEMSIYTTSVIKYNGKNVSMAHSDELPHSAGQEGIDPPENYSVSKSHHMLRNVIVKENFPDVADFFMLLYRQSRSARYKKYLFTDYETDLVAKLSLQCIINWANATFGVGLESL